MRRSRSLVLREPRRIGAIIAATVVTGIVVAAGAPAAAAPGFASGASKPPGLAGVRYKAIDLGFAADRLTINDRGQIAGYGNRRAYFWELGRVREIQVPDEFNYFVVGEINEAGTVVGTLVPLSSLDGSRAAIWHRGKFTVLPTFGLAQYEGTYGLSINDWGVVFGTGYSTVPDRSFVWYRGKLTPLWENNQDSSQVGINNWGDIVGQYDPRFNKPCTCRGAIWIRGELIDLGDFGDHGIFYVNEPRDLNNRREVVGYALVAGGYHAYHWRNGVLTDLGTLGGTNSRAYAINDRGQVIGEAETASGELRPFLWERGTMVDLTTRGLRPTDRVKDINIWGQIVGIRDGKATLFVPVPR